VQVGIDMAVERRDPSGRLFEAAACGCPLLSDAWEGLDAFFAPGHEILVASSTEEALAALDLLDAELRRIAEAARARALEEHSSARRSREMLALFERPFPEAHAPSPKRSSPLAGEVSPKATEGGGAEGTAGVLSGTTPIPNPSPQGRRESASRAGMSGGPTLSQPGEGVLEKV
jgi:hypothetical protein